MVLPTALHKNCCVCAGHGLQWLWPFLLGYASRKTAILDDVCILHPHNHMQYLLKLDVEARMQRITQAQKPKPDARSVRLTLRLSKSIAAQQRLSSDVPLEALLAAPGKDFLHVDAPGPALARKEARQLLQQYSYKAELYGVKDRSLETVEAVFQPWYQTLLDMGSIQVRLLLICLLCELDAVILFFNALKCWSESHQRPCRPHKGDAFWCSQLDTIQPDLLQRVSFICIESDLY